MRLMDSLVPSAPVSCYFNNAKASLAALCCVGKVKTEQAANVRATNRAGRWFAMRAFFVAGALLVASAANITLQAQTLIQVPSIVTYAGTGSLTVTNTGDGGLATAAGLNQPKGLAFDAVGNTYIADSGDNRIRVVNAQGIISAAYGSAAGTACAATTAACGDGGPISSANVLFNGPSGLAFDNQGNLYIADQQDHRVRKVTAIGGVITANSIIRTIAGTGTEGTANTGGDGGLATAANLNQPHVILPLPNGDIYFAEQIGCVIRYVPAAAGKVILNGVSTTTVAGHIYTVVGQDDACGYVSDASGTLQGTQTKLNAPEGIVLTPAGNLLIADSANARIRQWNPQTGVVTTVVGTGVACAIGTPQQANYVPANCGDGGAPANATLGGPKGLTYDESGNLIIGDSAGSRIRSVNPAFTVISTLAGTGQQCTNQAQTVSNAAYPVCGDGGAAAAALVSYPIVVATNAQGNILYVDQYNNKVREILPNTVFPNTTVATKSTAQNVILQATNLTVTSYTIPTSTSGVPEYIVGTVTGCAAGTAVTAATYCTVPVQFNPAYAGNQPQPLTVVTNAGTFYFNLNGVGVGPQAVLAPGTLSTVAGVVNGATTAAALTAPTHSAVDTQGNIYIADTGANVIRKIAAGTGTATVVAGTGATCTNPTAATAACGDGGLATAATFNAPTSVTFDAAGNLYISDSKDNRVRKITASTGIITTVAGNGGGAYTGDGVAATATAIGTPVAVAVDQNGDIYTVAKSDNAVRLVPGGNGLIKTFAGTNGTACANPTAATGACADGGVATSATLNAPSDIYIDPIGNVWIADTGDNRVRRVADQTNIITTIAGTGTAGYTGDGGLATAATLNAPTGVTVDAAGDAYIADSGNVVIREVTAANSNIVTFAGNGTACAAAASTCGDGGPANVAAFQQPQGIDLDAAGNGYVTDTLANRVRKIIVTSAGLTFANTPINTTSTDSPKVATLSNIGNAPLTLTAPTTAGAKNPSISAGFSDGSAGTCPQLANGSANGTLASGAQCTYSLSFTPTTTGTYAGQLVESDNSLYNTAATQTVALNGTGLSGTLTASPTSTTYGTPVTLTETIPEVGGVCPTGPATFLNNGVSIGTGPITGDGTNCVATYTTSNLPVGADPITATVPASNGYSAISSGPTTVTVAKAPITNPTTPSLSQSFTATTNPATNPTTSVFGGTVNLTYTIPVATGDAAPTGTVTFTNGTTTLGTCNPTTVGATVNGIAPYSCTIPTTALPVGNPDTVTATYSTTDANYAGGTPALTAPVVVTNPTTGLTASPTSTTYGTPVTLTETIPEVGGVCPTGPATFLNNGVSIGTGPITGNGTNCVATYTTSNLPVGADPITATVPASNGYGAISSGPTTVTVAKAPITNPTTPSLSQSFTATTNPATNPTTSAFGGTVNLTYTIPVATGDAAPTGTVTFTNGTTTLGTCNPTTVGATVNGIAPYSCTIPTTALPVGNPDTVTATYSTTDANYAGGTPALTAPVVVTNPTTGLTASPTSTTYGTPVTLTETIPEVGGVCPTGPATFLNNGVSIGTGPITGDGTNCVATYTTSNLPVGADPITATVPASNGYGAISSGPTTVTVAKAPITNPTTPSLSQSFTATTNPATNPTTSAFGGTVNLTYTIPVATGDAAPTGTVTFTNGTTTLGTCNPTTVGATVNGIAPYSCTIPTTALPVGNPDTVTATYSTTDANYAGGTPALTAPVVVTNPTTGLTASPTSTTYGTPVTLTETIPEVGGVCPTGPATFLNNGVSIGTGPITGNGTNCVATYTTSNLPVGADPITATVPASNGYGAISSGPTTVTVAKAPITNPTTPSLSQSFTATTNPATNPTTSAFGGTVNLTYTIPVATGDAAPTGTVTFTNGTTTLGTCNPTTVGATVNGIAPYSCTIPTTALPVGNPDTVTATYSTTDANYAGGTPALTAPVVVTNPTTGLTASPTSTTYGTPVTLTETIPEVGGVCPTGPATFLNNGVSIGTGPITGNGTNCVATYTTSNLPVGADPITATVPASNGYGAISSGPTTVTVAKAPITNPTTPSLSQSFTATTNPATNPTTSAFGGTVNLTYTIPVATGDAAPTGTVTFTNGTTTLGTCNPTTVGATVNGIAPYSCTIPTTALPVGNPDTVTATYSTTDANYAGGTPALTAPVVVTNPTTGLTASPTSTTYGTPVTLTETIPEVGGVCPTGPATFLNNGVSIGTGLIAGDGTNCVATYTTSNLPVGADPITATVPASNGYGAISSGPTTVTVAKAPITNPTTPSLSQSFTATTNPATNPTTSVFGGTVNLTYTIPVATGDAAPTGTVTFTNGTTTLGTCNPTTMGATVNGIAPYSCTIPTTALPVGNPDTVTATYSTTDANYAGGTPALTAPVVVTNPTTGLTASPTSTTYGTPVTLTETIPEVGGVCPTGPATFLNNGVSIGTGPITGNGTNCVATYTTSNLPVGADPITATVPASNGYGAISSGPTTVTIAVVNPPSVLTYSPQAPACGTTSVTFTDTITPINGVVPTGTVQFYTNLGPLGTPQPVVNGAATLSIVVPCGTLSAYGVYTGNSPYGTSTTPTASIGSADFTIAATPPTQTINPGDTVVYTVSLAGANGVAFNSPVTLTATGLPADATVTFGTPTYVPGLGPTPTSMTIVTSPLHAKVEPSGFGPKIFYGLLLLPLLGVRRIRRKIRSLPKGIVYGLAALMMLGGLGAITGCAGGYFGPAGAQYTITVTGTSGTLVHSTTVTLTVR